MAVHVNGKGCVINSSAVQPASAWKSKLAVTWFQVSTTAARGTTYAYPASWSMTLIPNQVPTASAYTEQQEQEDMHQDVL
jgi:hypothetical protein